MKLIVAGDSWTFGSEIRDPLLDSSIKDWDPENDEYRSKRIWSTFLGEKLNANEVINISYPGSSNDRIIRTTKQWLTKNIVQKEQNDDSLLIVGFTSPERKDFYYKDETTNNWITIWPLWSPDYRQPILKSFHKLYVNYMWNAEEYTDRYVNQVLDLQNFCKVYNIKFLFFQAFYQHKDLSIVKWNDAKFSIPTHTGIKELWNLVDDVRFMNKNKDTFSFHNFIMNNNHVDPLIDQHPSINSHKLWANEIYRYYKEHNL